MYSSSDWNYTQDILDRIEIAIRIWDVNQQRWNLINKATERVFGFDVAQFKNKPDIWLDQIPVDEVAKLQKQINSWSGKGTLTLYYTYYHPKGYKYLIAENRFINFDNHGNTSHEIHAKTERIITNLTDGSEKPLKDLESSDSQMVKEHIQEQLYESENRYVSIFQGSQAVMLLINPESGNIANANYAAAWFYGYPVQELITMNFADFCIESKDSSLQKIRQSINNRRFYHQFKQKLRYGEIRNIEVYSNPVKFGEHNLIFAIIHDITQRQKIEQQLVKTREYLSQTFEASPLAIILVDIDGIVEMWNKAAEQLFGWKEEEVLGMPYPLAQNEEQWKEFWAHLDKIKKGAQIAGKEIKRSHKDGYELDLALHTAPVTDSTGYISSVIAIFEDISERKKYESTIKNSLHEKEVLLREIHHRVKNNLAIISSLLQLQLDEVNDQEAVSALANSQSRIQSMAMVHEKLYQSEMFSKVSMDTYIKELVQVLYETFRKSDTVIEFEFDLDEVTLKMDKAITCGLLITELVTNAIKHAFPNIKRGIIGVELNQLENEELELKILDDGIGFSESFSFHNQNQLGSTLIQTFASQLKGKLKEYNDHGAIVSLRFNPEA